MIYEFNEYKPVVHESAFVHDLAAVTGNVYIGRDVYVGPGAAIRGDWGEIIIEDGCNIQENCTIHVFPGKSVVLRESAHIGHGAVIHGGKIGSNTLIGMNSVVMDDAEVGDECIIGALCFIRAEMKIPNRKLVVGNPAIIKGNVSDDMLEWKSEGTKIYQELPLECMNTLRECEPLRAIPKDRPPQKTNYKSWKETKK
ncbi:MAG: transferase hexapeptide repeat family protein [Candidatus Marinimicrobia bacterium]|nr:transferase hexapeptide repeat family protein [Candidatus Neomarinimicrobiota bacterium]